jgi:hypothetical protein
MNPAMNILKTLKIKQDVRISVRQESAIFCLVVIYIVLHGSF